MSAFDELFDVIGELARRRFQTAEREFAALRLNHTEARLLTILHREGGTATQERLSDQIHVDRTNVGRALKSLEQSGLIARTREATDKRTNTVSITAHGATMVVEIQRIREQIAEHFFGEISSEEAEQAAAILRKAVSTGHA